MKDCQCSNCNKRFDYGNYYGICPKCGTYNRKQEVNTTIHNISENTDMQGIYTQTQYTDKTLVLNNNIEEEVVKAKNVKTYAMSIALIIFAVAFLPVRFYFIAKQADEFRANRDLTPIMCEVGDVLEAPSGTIEVLEAVEVIQEDTNPYFPEGKKLIGIKARYTPKIEDNFYEIVWGMPIVSDSNQNYKNAVSTYNVEPFLLDTQLGGGVLFDSYYSYNYKQEEGYFTYLVDSNLTEITVLLQQMEEYEYQQVPKTVYQLTLPIAPKEVE